MLPSEMPATPLSEWVTEAGDSFVVDTRENIGYLLHEKGGYTVFPIATGQRRVVRYIGRTYDATTPVGAWKVTSVQVKGDRITFGKTGRFLRLSSIETSGTLEDTSYGIHSHAYIDKMLSRSDRFRSMGCVLVSEDMLNVILSILEENEGSLTVVTTAGFGEELSVTEPMLREVLQKIGTTVQPTNNVALGSM
jgi:hypothetical protein